MCFGPSARPPLPPIAGGSGIAHGHDLVLRAEDGNSFAAFSALAPSDDGRVGIVILPDVRGLHAFYRELALRFAASTRLTRGSTPIAARSSAWAISASRAPSSAATAGS